MHIRALWIAAACAAVGRDAGEVTLVAVTKTFPASDVRLLYEIGVRDMGENRDQEAAPKAAECADLAPGLTWHFVGQLQRNIPSIQSTTRTHSQTFRFGPYGQPAGESVGGGFAPTCAYLASRPA